jgi:hypothetical protein
MHTTTRHPFLSTLTPAAILTCVWTHCLPLHIFTIKKPCRFVSLITGAHLCVLDRSDAELKSSCRLAKVVVVILNLFASIESADDCFVV